MSEVKHTRWILGVGLALAVFLLAGIAAMHFAARSVKESIQEALGPEGEAAEMASLAEIAAAFAQRSLAYQRLAGAKSTWSTAFSGRASICLSVGLAERLLPAMSDLRFRASGYPAEA